MWRLYSASVVIAASRGLKQHAQRNIDVDAAIFQKIGGVTGTVQLLHADSLLHETGGVPVRSGWGGSGKVPGIFVSVRLHDRLFVKEKKNRTCAKATIASVRLYMKGFLASVRNRTNN